MVEDRNDKKTLKYGIIGGVVSLIVGIIIILIGYKISIDNEEKSKKYTEVDATIVEYAEKTNDRGTKLYAIIVQYEVEDINYKLQSKVYNSNPKKIGEIVKVKYNPENPIGPS